MSLRNKIIRLAAEKPELRKHLLPLVRQAGSKNFFHENISDLLSRESPSKYSLIGTLIYVSYEKSSLLPVPFQLMLDLRNPTILTVIIPVGEGEDTHNIDLSKQTKNGASKEIMRFLKWHKNEEGY